MMHLVDTSGWLEYFADTPNAVHFVKPLAQLQQVVVPVICLYETFKHILRQKDEAHALQAVTVMQQGYVIDMDVELSLNAAKISHEHKMPMADSLILATAKRYDATIWTQDKDFEGLAGVKYFPKQQSRP